MEHVSPFPPARSPEFAFTDTHFPPSNLVVDKCVHLSKELPLTPAHSLPVKSLLPSTLE